MKLYLSRELLLEAVMGFRNLSEGDEIKQGLTQDVSAIRHCLALDRVLKTNAIQSVKLQHKTDEHLSEFITFVGDTIKLDENGCYTTNLVNDIKIKSDYGVGSNLLSAGVATHSSQSIQTYPKKSNKGLISIDDYKFSLLNDFIGTLKSTYKLSRAQFSFLIWLNRFSEFSSEDDTPEKIFNKLTSLVASQYSSALAQLIIYSDVNQFKSFIKDIGTLLSEEKTNLVDLFSSNEDQTSQLPKQLTNISQVKTYKPFLLLAGISGTGKTRFVRKQAEATGQLNETYCLTSVRPDWHEPSDLLGYISRLSGKAEYVTTDVIQFIAKAWRSIIDSGLTVDVVNLGERGERLSVSGDKNILGSIKPYWLCLDEMNLAPVEQYFADYLSVLETREWDWNGEEFIYSSDALLKPEAINEIYDTNKLRTDLGFGTAVYDEVWRAICQHGLQIPFNLIVAGTVNMDETTHGFSRKVIDRALSFDFGGFFPNDYSEYLEPSCSYKTISFPFWSDAKTSIGHLKDTNDENGHKSIEFLNSVNSILKNTPFELAYRALNELLLAVISAQPKSDLALKAVWDDFLMCKVLPRIEGDVDKLGSEKSLLVQLESKLSELLSPIWNADKDSDNARPDLHREKLVAEDAPEDEKAIRIKCRSKGKIEWMNDRLSSAGFTSFWP